MKKCYSSQPDAHSWPEPSDWTGGKSRLASEEIIHTCDAVALWIVDPDPHLYPGCTPLRSPACLNAPQGVLDCTESHLECSTQTFPPPRGHWGSIYKPRVEGKGCGEEIQQGDEVYFERMWDMTWGHNLWLTLTSGDWLGS